MLQQTQRLLGEKMILLVKLKLLGSLFTSSHAQNDQSQSGALCPEVAACMYEINKVPESRKLLESMGNSLQSLSNINSSSGILFPKFSKEQFKSICDVFDMLRGCFDKTDVAVKCKDYSSFAGFKMLLKMCQQPNRQGFQQVYMHKSDLNASRDQCKNKYKYVFRSSKVL